MFSSKLYLMAQQLRRVACGRPPRMNVNFTTTSRQHYPEGEGNESEVAGEPAGEVEGDKMPPIVDIDFESMMLEDPSLGGRLGMPFEQEAADAEVVTTDIGVPLAPVDIDGWADQEEEKQGTVDIDGIEEKPIEYPPIPQTRVGSYEFQGIKVFLPQRLLTPQTYRYRLDPEEQNTIADDMRICRFDK